LFSRSLITKVEIRKYQAQIFTYFKMAVVSTSAKEGNMKVASVFLMLLFIVASNCYAGSSGPNDIKAFNKACLSAMNLDGPVCKCVAQKAGEKLTPVGFAYLVASLSLDNAKAAKLRDKIEASEVAEVGMFMMNAPYECSKALGGN